MWLSASIWLAVWRCDPPSALFGESVCFVLSTDRHSSPMKTRSPPRTEPGRCWIVDTSIYGLCAHKGRFLWTVFIWNQRYYASACWDTRDRRTGRHDT